MNIGNITIRDIQDSLIGAESVIRELSLGRVGPAPLRGQALPYVHSETDMRNWGHRRGEKRSKATDANACRLLPEDDDAHSIYRREFWDGFVEPPSSGEISEAHRILDLVMVVDDDGERRALRAWSYAMAGGRPFARWCKRVEKIAVMTGRRRKNRAVEKILAHLASKRDLHDENGLERVLPVTPEIRDVSGTLTSATQGHETGLNSWASDDAFQPFMIVHEVYDSGAKRISIPTQPSEFTWADKRNERRRQREKRKAA